jgi:hypothetical protein
VKKTTILLAALALALAAPAMADHPRKGGKNKDKSASEEVHKDQGKGKGKGQGGKKFNSDERDEIVHYFGANPSAREQLPPGLAKKNKIPPGWQKKLDVGQRIPDDVWAYRVPLPHEVLVKLPPPPPGVIHVRIQDHVLKVIEKTHEVLDKIGLPHPPTPRR